MGKVSVFEKAAIVHNNKYDYSKSVFKGYKEKMAIICPRHGEFWQTPDKHIYGKQGCPKCSRTLRSNTSSFIEKAIAVHGNEYDYSKVDYTNSYTKVCIVCPKHGDFWQTPHNHLKGKGCPICAKCKMSSGVKLSHGEVVNRANEIHGSKYSYNKLEFNTTKDKGIITCPIHGDFEQEIDSHIRGCGCPRCGNSISKGEDEIYEFVCSLVGKDNVSKRYKCVFGFEIDVYVDSLKVGIEFNGVRWHSELFLKDKNYHLNKLEKCNRLGIKLIEVFEDEFKFHRDIVLSKIRHLLHKDGCIRRIQGRKCVINEISNDEARIFLDVNHIQGFSPSSVYLGAIYDKEIVGVMSFKKYGDRWELSRFASDNDSFFCGVGGKLLSYFIKNYSPSEIYTFADKRWTVSESDNFYTKVGFRLDKILKPDYRYYFNSKFGINRVHKSNFRKNALSKEYGFPMTMTESEMAAKIGAYKVWDCGLLRYKIVFDE